MDKKCFEYFFKILLSTRKYTYIYQIAVQWVYIYVVIKIWAYCSF